MYCTTEAKKYFFCEWFTMKAPHSECLNTRMKTCVRGRKRQAKLDFCRFNSVLEMKVTYSKLHYFTFASLSGWIEVGPRRGFQQRGFINQKWKLNHWARSDINEKLWQKHEQSLTNQPGWRGDKDYLNTDMDHDGHSVSQFRVSGIGRSNLIWVRVSWSQFTRNRSILKMRPLKCALHSHIPPCFAVSAHFEVNPASMSTTGRLDGGHSSRFQVARLHKPAARRRLCLRDGVKCDGPFYFCATQMQLSLRDRETSRSCCEQCRHYSSSVRRDNDTYEDLCHFISSSRYVGKMSAPIVHLGPRQLQGWVKPGSESRNKPRPSRSLGVGGRTSGF